MNDDATGFGKLELCFAELEGLRKRLDARFREADLQPDALRLFNELCEHVVRIAVGRNEDRIVVHVVPCAFQMKLAFQKIVNRRRQRDHLHLADLNTERQSHTAGNEKTIGKISNVGMQKDSLVSLIYCRMRRRREEFFEVGQNDPAFPSVMAVVPPEFVGKRMK